MPIPFRLIVLYFLLFTLPVFANSDIESDKKDTPVFQNIINQDAIDYLKDFLDQEDFLIQWRKTHYKIEGYSEIPIGMLDLDRPFDRFFNSSYRHTSLLQIYSVDFTGIPKIHGVKFFMHDNSASTHTRTDTTQKTAQKPEEVYFDFKYDDDDYEKMHQMSSGLIQALFAQIRKHLLHSPSTTALSKVPVAKTDKTHIDGIKWVKRQKQNTLFVNLENSAIDHFGLNLTTGELSVVYKQQVLLNKENLKAYKASKQLRFYTEVLNNKHDIDNFLKSNYLQLLLRKYMDEQQLSFDTPVSCSGFLAGANKLLN